MDGLKMFGFINNQGSKFKHQWDIIFDLAYWWKEHTDETKGIKEYPYILLVEIEIATAFEGQSDIYYEKLSKCVSLI